MRLDRTFTTWTEYAQKRDLRQREINLDRIISLSGLKIVAVTGLRRAGKSSLLMLLAQRLRSQGKKVSYINLEDPQISLEEDGWDQLLAWHGVNKEGYLILDEVTAKPGWDSWMAKVHELHKDKLHLIVSSSRSGLAIPPKVLRGRMSSVEVFPLTFTEYQDFKGVIDDGTELARTRSQIMFEEYLLTGGFPEIVLLDDSAERKVQLLDYFQEIVAMDVMQATGYSMLEVEKAVQYMVRAPYFSASKCANHLSSIGIKTSRNRLLELERVAKESYLFHYLEIFAYDIKNKNQYPRKCHAGDIGFYSAILGEIDRGRTLESTVYLHIRKTLGPHNEINYWKDPKDREVDLVISDNGRAVTAVQICTDVTMATTMDRELQGLVSSSAILKTKRHLLISEKESWAKDVDGVRIEAVPFIEWVKSLRDLGSGAILPTK